ncbi:DUF433 domain-containing protein [Phormidesmis priestleyi]
MLTSATANPAFEDCATPSNSGVAESKYESLGSDISSSPLNPPQVRDFESLEVPQNGGWGANSYHCSATPEFILELLSGMTIDEILADYADLEREDMVAALLFAAPFRYYSLT